MGNDLLKLSIERAVKEIAVRPAGSVYLIRTNETEKLKLLSKVVAMDLFCKTLQTFHSEHSIFNFLKSKKKSEKEISLFYQYDCDSKILTNMYGNNTTVKHTDDEFATKKVCENINNSIPCVLLLLNFDHFHPDAKINSWNQNYVAHVLSSEKNENLLHSDSIIIACDSGKGKINNMLQFKSFELI